MKPQQEAFVSLDRNYRREYEATTVGIACKLLCSCYRMTKKVELLIS